MWNNPLFVFLNNYKPKKSDNREQKETKVNEQKIKYFRAVLSRHCTQLTSLFEGRLQERWTEDYNQTLNECVQEFSCISNTVSQYKKEGIVIAACVGKNKIFDYFRNVIDFYNSNINESQSAEKIAVKGYGNFIFVIKCLMKDLIEEYEAFEVVEIAANITHRKFLKEECNDNELLNSWQSFRTRARAVFENHSSDIVELANLIQESEQFEIAFRKDKDILCSYMTEKKEAYSERNFKMQKDIADGKELYKDLCNLLTDDLFENFNPDSQNEFSKDFEQVKNEYKMLTDEFSRIINKYSIV